MNRDTALELCFLALYAAAVGATLVLVFPGLRTACWKALEWNLYAYNLGIKIEAGRTTWERTPAWRKEALQVRGLADEKGLTRRPA